MARLDQVVSGAVAAQYDRPWKRISADLRAKIRSGRWQAGDRLPPMAELQRQYGVAKGTIQNAINQLASDGYVATRPGSGIYVQEVPVPDSATSPEPQPVVAAIVTSHLGVLVTKRHDGRPLFGFVSGEIEPGESQVDAAVREVKEETGLEVRAGHHEIGRRVHPRTGRTMIYLACQPVGATDVFVGDPVELAEVRWVPTVDELCKLIPREQIFPPVLEHLGRMIP